MSEACRLYLVSPPKIELGKFARDLEEALSAEGGVASFQLRLKEASDAAIKEAVKELLPVCHAHETAFILNDRFDIAAELGADGVHLGQEDMEKTPIKFVRGQAGPEMVIGATCHSTLHLAMTAGEQGADYVAFGAFYPTTSKPQEKMEKWGTPAPEILTRWSEMAALPCVAIGGITAENCAPLVKAGADFIAVITAVWNYPEGAKAGVKAMNQAIKAVL